MQILKLSLLALGFLLLNASSCRRDDTEETLPPETQTGANTFGCLVNGKVWINEGMTAFSSGNLWATLGSNEFEMTAIKTNNNSIYQSIFIDLKTPISLGPFILRNEASGFADGKTNCIYKTDSVSSVGTLKITKFDTVNFIISGTFNFKAAKLSTSTGSCDSIVNVTEGRFDIKYAN